MQSGDGDKSLVLPWVQALFCNIDVSPGVQLFIEKDINGGY